MGPGITEASSVGYDLSFLQPSRSRLPSLIPSERGESEGRSSSASKDDLVLTPPRKQEANDNKGRSNSVEGANGRSALLDLGDTSMRDSAVFGTAPDPRRLSDYDDL